MIFIGSDDKSITSKDTNAEISSMSYISFPGCCSKVSNTICSDGAETCFEIKKSLVEDSVHFTAEDMLLIQNRAELDDSMTPSREFNLFVLCRSSISSTAVFSIKNKCSSPSSSSLSQIRLPLSMTIGQAKTYLYSHNHTPIPPQSQIFMLNGMVCKREHELLADHILYHHMLHHRSRVSFKKKSSKNNTEDKKMMITIYRSKPSKGNRKDNETGTEHQHPTNANSYNIQSNQQHRVHRVPMAMMGNSRCQKVPKHVSKRTQVYKGLTSYRSLIQRKQKVIDSDEVKEMLLFPTSDRSAADPALSTPAKSHYNNSSRLISSPA